MNLSIYSNIPVGWFRAVEITEHAADRHGWIDAADLCCLTEHVPTPCCDLRFTENTAMAHPYVPEDDDTRGMYEPAPYNCWSDE